MNKLIDRSANGLVNSSWLVTVTLRPKMTLYVPSFNLDNPPKSEMSNSITLLFQDLDPKFVLNPEASSFGNRLFIWVLQDCYDKFPQKYRIFF